MYDKDARIMAQGKFAIELCKALNIDPKTCVGISLDVHVGEVVTVTVKRNVRVKEAAAYALLMEKYDLVLKETDQDVTSLADEAIRKAIKGAP